MTTVPHTEAEAAVVAVRADASEKLAQLHAAYDEAAAEYAAASSKLEAIKAGIKTELMTQAPEGTTKVALTGPYGPPLAMTYAESWRVDSRRLKREEPETYVRFATKSGSWSLRPAGGDPR